MLLRHQPEVSARPRALCLVVNGACGLMAEHDPLFSLTESLRATGWHVRVLCAASERPLVTACAQQARAAGLEFSSLDDCSLPPSFRVRTLIGEHADRSDRVRHALERFTQEHPVGVIAFAAGGGLGFRSVQARRAGVAFTEVAMMVVLDTCSPWQREQDHRWPTDLEDLAVDFAERYAFEHADRQVVCSAALREYVRRLGWSLRTPVEPPDVPQACETLLCPATTAPGPLATPLVTVALPHYNLGRYLPAALASLAAQTYPNIEILVIDDGSTDPASLRVLEEMRSRYPQIRFLSQPNAGIGATRNRGLWEARGEYFLPMDADNVARPDMIERFVTFLERQPDLGAATCYFLAFADGDPTDPSRLCYANRPTGGPHTLASIRNVYGDGNALFRTAVLRAVGGFETDRDTSFEDWEVFVKLVHAGQHIDVLPDHLFYYRHLESGFSRITDSYRNHRRILRQFLHLDHVPATERSVLWLALHGFQRQLATLTARHQTLPHRLADALIRLCHPLKRGLDTLTQVLTGMKRRRGTMRTK